MKTLRNAVPLLALAALAAAGCFLVSGQFVVNYALPSPLRVTRYHSLIVSESGLPADLEVTARTPEGEIMALRHRRHPVAGVQFHPEALLTERGHDLLRNFLEGRS